MQLTAAEKTRDRTSDRFGHRQLRLVDVDIDLSWNYPDPQAVGASIFGDAPAGDTDGISLNLRRTNAGYTLVGAGYGATQRRTLGELFQDAEMAITEAALDSLRHRYLTVHAAVVAHNGAGLLLIGGHDACKTSLGCALARTGALLLSDEVGPVCPADLFVQPFPRDLILHAGTSPSLGGLPPAPGFKCFHGYRYLPPSAVNGATCTSVPVRGLLFPARAAVALPGLSHQSQAQSARVLLQQCFDLEGVGGETATDCASRLAQLPAANISFSNAADALELVWRWWESEVESGVVR